LSGGRIPLAITVLQVLALDIGTDLLPALALGAEPPNPNALKGPARDHSLVDGRLLRRVFGVLGPAEAVAEMAAFAAVLLAGGWAWGETVDADLLATASGTAFTAVVLGQLANAYACRGETLWVGGLIRRRNPLLHLAVLTELLMLFAFLGIPLLSETLGGAMPSALGWLTAPPPSRPSCSPTPSTKPFASEPDPLLRSAARSTRA
jgi:magnesium-transporting ATPase (P-type)